MSLGTKAKSTTMIGAVEVELLHERQHYKVYLSDNSQAIFIVDKKNNTVLDEFWAEGDDMAHIEIVDDD